MICGLSKEYRKDLILNIVDIISYDIVLRMTWLRKHNSQINWREETVTLKYKYMFISESRC